MIWADRKHLRWPCTREAAVLETRGTIPLAWGHSAGDHSQPELSRVELGKGRAAPPHPVSPRARQSVLLMGLGGRAAGSWLYVPQPRGPITPSVTQTG